MKNPGKIVNSGEAAKFEKDPRAKLLDKSNNF